MTEQPATPTPQAGAATPNYSGCSTSSVNSSPAPSAKTASTSPRPTASSPCAGCPNCPRRWTVRIGLTFICEVTAGTDDDAFDTAEDAIAAAVTDAACPIDIDWDGREHLQAAAGGVDHHALDTPPDPA
jgi:hypothetical protein